MNYYYYYYYHCYYRSKRSLSFLFKNKLQFTLVTENNIYTIIFLFTDPSFTKKNDYFHTVSFKISASIFFGWTACPLKEAPLRMERQKNAANLVTLWYLCNVNSAITAHDWQKAVC